MKEIKVTNNKDYTRYRNILALDNININNIVMPMKKDRKKAVDLFLVAEGENPTKNQVLLAKIFRHMQNMFPNSFEKDLMFIRKNIEAMEDSKYRGAKSLNALQDIIEKKCLQVALNGINSSIIEKKRVTDNDYISKLRKMCEKSNISDEITDIFMVVFIKAVVSSVNREVEGDRERVISVSQFVHFFTSNFIAETTEIPWEKYFRDPNLFEWVERSKWQKGISKRGRKKTAPNLNNKDSFIRLVLNYLTDLGAQYLTIFFGNVVLKKYEIASKKVDIPSVRMQKCWTINGKDDNEILQSITRAYALIGVNTPKIAPPLPYNRALTNYETSYGVNKRGKKLCSHNGLSRKVVDGKERDHKNIYLNKINTLQNTPFTLSLQMVSDVIALIDHNCPNPVDDFYPEKKSCRNLRIKEYIKELRNQHNNLLDIMKNSEVIKKYSYIVPKIIHLEYENYNNLLNKNNIKEILSKIIDNKSWISKIIDTNDKIRVYISGSTKYENDIFTLDYKGYIFIPKIKIKNKFSLSEWSNIKQVKRFKQMVDRFRENTMDSDTEKTRRCLISLIVYSYCFDNKPLYFPIITDHRGRMYTQGENNPINSKLFRKFVTLNSNIAVDKNNKYLDYYIASQIEKQRSLEISLKSNNKNSRNFVELAKIISCYFRNTTFSVGMDATSSVCQHLAVLAQDEQLLIDSNVISSNNELFSKDVYESIIKHIMENDKIDIAIKHLCRDRGFVKVVIMKWLYNSTAWKIAKDIRKDNKDVYSLWEHQILIKAAATCTTAFRKKYPKAYKLRNAIASYGHKIYKQDNQNMIFKFKDQTISYTHKEVETILILLNVGGDVKRVRVDVKLLNSDKTVKKREDRRLLLILYMLQTLKYCWTPDMNCFYQLFIR